MLTAFAPCATAWSTAASRSVVLSLLASTSTILQSGQVADTISTSSAISGAHEPLAGAGAGYTVLPFCAILRKQPLAVVHAPSPKSLRYAARSVSTFGLSHASTIPTSLPAPSCVDGRAYALQM